MVSDFSRSVDEEAVLNFTAEDFADHFTDDGIACWRSGELLMDTQPLRDAGDRRPGDCGCSIGEPDVLPPVSCGTYKFTWDGSDGSLYSGVPATVTLTVNAVNHPPVVNKFLRSVAEDAVLSFSANDFTSCFKDQDGDSLSAVVEIVAAQPRDAQTVRVAGEARPGDRCGSIGEPDVSGNAQVQRGRRFHLERIGRGPLDADAGDCHPEGLSRQRGAIAFGDRGERADLYGRRPADADHELPYRERPGRCGAGGGDDPDHGELPEWRGRARIPRYGLDPGGVGFQPRDPFKGAQSVANYQAALRSVTYRNTSENPSEAVRTVSFQVSDGALESNVATRDIAVTAVDDPPTASVTTPTGLQTGDVTIAYSLADAESETCSIAVQYSPDGGQTWNSITAGPGGDGTTGLKRHSERPIAHIRVGQRLRPAGGAQRQREDSDPTDGPKRGRGGGKLADVYGG